MSEELIQRNLIKAPEKMGHWDYYNIGNTTLKALKKAKIIPNRDYKGFESKKPDALIVNRPQIIAAIEYKQPKELRTQKQISNAVSQELGTAQVLGARLYIITDGQKTIWINPLTGNEITTEDGSLLALNFDKNNVECIKLINKAIVSINASNDMILASAIVDPLPLAQRVWQDLWAVSGATPENCLYTFVELFIFKYLSDLGVLTGSDSFDDLLNRYLKDSDERVLVIYADTVRSRIKELFPINQKDNTTIINGTIFVSKDNKAVSGYATVFKKILERFRDFGSLENIDYDFKSKLFETFLKESISKKNWGQFFTPLKVVRAIISMTDITPGMSICDPACGVGKFLLELILHDIHRWFKINNGNLIPQIMLYGFDKGFDKDEQKTIILAKANMLIYMSAMIKEYPGLTKQFSKLFNDTFLLQTNSILGTLANPIENEYDLILTNPPYVMSGSSNLKDEISKKTPEEIIQKRKSILEQHYAISAMGVEGLFMEWIIRALKPGGKAFIVVPDGIMNRANDKRLRDFILDECNINAIISLPLNTFFTTNKKTYIMALTKKIPVTLNGLITKNRQMTPVFTYFCSEIGETRDVYRFDIGQNDLDVAATLYNSFKGIQKQLPVVDKRCKIVSIDEFYNTSHWSIERWWTREEKVELGIEGEVDSISIEEFISVIDDTAMTLAEFKEPLRELIKKNSEFVNKKKVKLNDKNLFELLIGKRLLRKDYFSSSGNIPAYSSNVFTPFVQTKESNIDDFTVPYVIWGIDGNFEFNVIETGSLFSITDHCGAIKIKNQKINPYYLAYILRQKKHVYGFDRGLRASLTNMQKVEIEIPVDDSGDFDLTEQRKIADKFTLFNDMRKEINRKYTEIVDSNVRIDLSEYVMYEYSLGEILTPIKGKSMYTKKYGDIHKGDYPVFSASSNAPLTYIDTYDYDGDYLSWSTNGFAGTVTILSGKFSINGDRGILLPKQEGINIQYLRYILQPIFRRLAKGRKGDKGEDEFTKLYPSMIFGVQIPFPINDRDEISLSAQQEIAYIYSEIDKYKSEIFDKLSSLTTQRVNL